MWFFIIIAFIVLLYLFLISPAIRKHPQKQNINNLYVAHRGLHNIEQGIPENSILSFKNAMKHGFAIEIDIHLTKDGQVVIFHDDNLKRVCKVDKIIEDTTLEELSEYTLCGTSEKIPTLEQLLKIANDKTMLVIEFKCNTKNYKSLCEKADEILKKYDVPYIVQSFNPLAIRWYKLNRAEVCRGQLSTNFLARNKKINILEAICGLLLLNFLSRPDFISYENKYFKSFARRICIKLGAISAGWTISSQNELDNCLNKYSIYIFENFIPNKKV